MDKFVTCFTAGTPADTALVLSGLCVCFVSCVGLRAALVSFERKIQILRLTFVWLSEAVILLQ